MRRCLRILFCLFLTGGLYQICPGSVALGQQRAPAIERVDLTGKRLVVTGVEFDSGAVVEIGGRPVTTHAALDTPTQTLIAKKGGKRIPVGSASVVNVRNSDNQLSRPFFIFRTDDFIAADVIALNTQLSGIVTRGAYLLLKPDDYFVVDLSGIGGISLTETQDGTMVLDRLIQPPFDDNIKLLYRVRKTGTAVLRFLQKFDPPGGDLPPFDLSVFIEVK
jgi:hypothetical protein